MSCKLTALKDWIRVYLLLMATMEDPCDVETYKGVGVRLVSETYKGVGVRLETYGVYWKKGVLRYFVCSKQGFKKRRAFDSLNAENNKGKQKRRKPSSLVGCDAHVKLRLVNGKCEICYFKEEQNQFFIHKEDVMFLLAARRGRVDHVKESVIQALAAINLGSVRAFNILKSLMGGYAEVGATKADFKNYKRDLNKYIGEYDTDMIVQLILNKKKHLSNFTCEYTVKEDGTLGGLFWADDVSKTNYMMFGDVVGFDATYRSNKYDMVFVPFTCIDNHNRNVTLGAAILGSEIADAYKWLSRTYINAIGNPPQVIVTDQDVAIKRAILDVLPNSRHRLCMWHIWDKVTAKVGSVLCNTTDFKKRMCDIIWTDSITPDEFEKQWDIILSDFVEFYGNFESAMDAQRYEHRKNDHDTRYTEPELWSAFILEKQAAQIFTRTFFLDQQLKIDDALNNCLSVSVVHLNVVSNYEIKDFLQPCSEYFKVMIRIEDMTLSCSCNRFEQFGLICRHIFYVLRVSDIKEYPKKYVLRRWTRDAVPNSSLRFEFIPEGCDKNWYEVEAIVRDIKATNDYIINRLVTNKYALSGYCDYLKSYKSKADEVEMVAPPLSRKARFASSTGMEEKNEVKIRVPIKQWTKGRPKRMKSAREIAISQAVSLARKKLRKCGFCKEPGHTQCTCGLYIQSIKRSASSSTGQASSSSTAVDPIMSTVDPIVP
ncbi:hypothetical protein QVD17_28875 [Tagetes erecta]|uniref:SWIM-type domain-containing protein n=1 Tax=Tagetes erecta TaxID=13708 RepID=A0AAD8NSK7_TARER|nr:hypothetical protein QVD17_28875 [Tagetes erecta]